MRKENLGTYTIGVVGLTRDLPKVRLSSDLVIASFVMLGDVELVEMCAQKLYVELADLSFDYVVCPAAKAIPLAHGVARRLKIDYIVARKSIKGYMTDPIIKDLKSITTLTPQQLVMNRPDVEKIKNKNVLLLDDVVSTGGSFKALDEIALEAEANVVARATVLLEGDLGADPGVKDLIYLARLPIFK